VPRSLAAAIAYLALTCGIKITPVKSFDVTVRELARTR
jgi:hypothetical protein